MLKSYKYIFLIFTILSVFLSADKAEALTLSPVRFELSGDPGETINGEIKLLNESVSEETFYTSFANFEAQGETGAPAFTEPKEGLGTWIRTEGSVFTIPSGKQITVPFSINIPQNAEPGGHFAVVFFGNSPSNSDRVSVGSQTGALVLLSVNGEVEENANLLEFRKTDNKFWYKTLPVSFEYRFANNGGDRIKPNGDIVIRNTLFIRSDKLDANAIEGNVLPNSIRKFKVDWIKYERPVDYIVPDKYVQKFFDNVSYEWKNFALGLYSANLKLEFGSNGEVAQDRVFFFVFPWELFIVLLFSITILWKVGKYTIVRYNNYIIKKAKASLNN